MLEDSDFAIFSNVTSAPIVSADVAVPISQTAAPPISSSSGPETVKMADSFADLGVSPWLVETLKSLSIRRPTPVQAACIPALLEGRNTVAIAPTGQGKTATFAIPILQALSRDPYGVFGVIITPTRELAFQMDEQIKVFGQKVSVRTSVIVGGMDNVSQGLDLVSRRPHIIIATPGRLADLIRSSLSSEFRGLVKRMAFLVFDEADRLLLDPCFGPDLKDILQQLPPREKRITVLASATNTSGLAAIYSNWKHSNPFIFTDNDDGDEDDDEMGDDFMFRKKRGNSASGKRVIKKQFRLVETLDQRYMVIPSKLKDCYLSYLLLERPEFQKKGTGGSLSSVIIFVSKCKICDLVTVMLQQMGIIATALHSGLSQKDRLKSLALFKSGKVPVLVTTDLGSRGLDIPQVQWVINYSLPLDVRDYVHRVGRTARAGKGGHALSLVGEMDIELLQFIESHTTNAQWSPLFKEEESKADDDDDDDDAEAKGAREKNNSKKFNNSEVTMKLFYEKEAMKLLKRVLQAKRVASIRLIEKGDTRKLKNRNK